MFGQYALRFFSRNWAFRPATGKKPGFTERLRSKSGFKLLELNERYNFLKPGLRVLELGAGRGGWTEVIVKCVKSTPANPLVLAVDIKSHPTVEGAEMIIADVSEEDSYTQIMTALKHPVDVLLSDLSDGVFGDRDLDCIVSCSHCFDALRVANVTLKPGGFMLIRMLTGANEQEQFVSVT